MTTEALEQLLFVLDETPEPPVADADPLAVLEAAQIMAIRREGHITALQELLGPRPEEGYALNANDRRMLAEVRERDARWHAAIERARREMGDRRAALARVKRLLRNSE